MNWTQTLGLRLSLLVLGIGILAGFGFYLLIKSLLAGLRQLVGGELKEYTEMLSAAREEALARMVKEAEELGADAVINVRFMTSQIMASAAEILAYGTAVKLE